MDEDLKGALTNEDLINFKKAVVKHLKEEHIDFRQALCLLTATIVELFCRSIPHMSAEDATQVLSNFIEVAINNFKLGDREDEIK